CTYSAVLVIRARVWRPHAVEAARRALPASVPAGNAARLGRRAALALLRPGDAAHLRAALRGAGVPGVPPSAGGAGRVPHLLRAGTLVHAPAAADGDGGGGSLADRRRGRCAPGSGRPGRDGQVAGGTGRL